MNYVDVKIELGGEGIKKKKDFIRKEHEEKI